MKIMLDDGAYMPTRAYSTDAGLDLYSPVDVMIMPQAKRGDRYRGACGAAGRKRGVLKIQERLKYQAWDIKRGRDRCGIYRVDPGKAV